MCNRITSAKQIRCAKTVYWVLINSNMNKRDVQEGCANGLYRVCTHSSNTDDENMNVLQLIMSLFASLTLNGGGRIFHSLSSPLFSLLALLYCLIYWETLSALLSKLKDYGFDQLVSQRNWHHLLDEKLGFWGTCLPWRNVRSWLHDGRMGEVADSVFSGSFRGGHWRYLPIRNHDNRSSADWIRLCPGLSKNSENRIFFGSPTSTGLGQGRCWKITPGKSTAVRRSCVPPPLYRHWLQTITHTHT